MKKAILFSFFVFGLFILSASAQTATVAGDWDAAMNTPGGARPFKLALVVDGEKLTGTVKRSSGDVPLVGTIKDNVINFSYTINYNGNDLTLSFSGTVAGDNISGAVSFGGNAEDSWNATRTKVEKPKAN